MAANAQTESCRPLVQDYMKDLMLTNDDNSPVVSEMDEVFILSDAISESTSQSYNSALCATSAPLRLGGDVVGLGLEACH